MRNGYNILKTMPIRIIYTINNLHTAGSKLVLANLIKRLDRTKFEPVIAVNRKYDVHLERELEKISKVFELPLSAATRPRISLPFELWRISHKLKGKADIIHSFKYSSDWTEPLIARLAGIPYIMTKTNLSWNTKRWWIKSFLSNKIVCLSDAQIKLMAKWRNKIVKIPVGVDIEQFEKATPASRHQFGLKKSDIVLVSVAHLVPVKGHIDLIHAFFLVHKELPALKLLLVGTGEPEYVTKLKTLVNSLGLKEKIIFLGESNNVPSILKMSDGKILATRNEGRKEAFGTALVEAMAARLPVIATKSGGPEEIVVNNVTGWLVDANNPEALAQAIREFYQSPQKREQFGRAGFERAKKLYNVNLMVKRYTEIYDEILQS